MLWTLVVQFLCILNLHPHHFYFRYFVFRHFLRHFYLSTFSIHTKFYSAVTLTMSICPLHPQQNEYSFDPTQNCKISSLTCICFLSTSISLNKRKNSKIDENFLISINSKHQKNFFFFFVF